MKKEFIEEQLKIAKKQNKASRYEYLCSQFNAIDYCIALEKYTIGLQRQLHSASIEIQSMIERDIECPSNCSKLKNKQDIIDRAVEYIDNYDVFKTFNFPLMKKWEEQEVKSSIDYELKTSLIKDLKEILEDKGVE